MVEWKCAGILETPQRTSFYLESLKCRPSEPTGGCERVDENKKFTKFWMYNGIITK